MNRQEFASTMNSFNNIVQNHPPPPSLSSGRIAFFILCLSTSILCAIVLGIHYTHHIAMLLAVPFSFLLLSIIVIAWRRRLKSQVKLYFYYSNMSIHSYYIEKQQHAGKRGVEEIIQRE